MINKSFKRGLLGAICLSFAVAHGVSAQSSPGQNWSGAWGFSTATDRSVGVQRATAIRNAEQSQGPTTVVNTTNYNSYTTDNRNNYVDVATGGEVTTDFHIGDEIGQNTNAVGSMNTGNTTIDINGSENAITAVNSADNTGCIDGSALTNTLSDPGSSGSLGLPSVMAGGGMAGVFGSPPEFKLGNIGSPVKDCVR